MASVEARFLRSGKGSVGSDSSLEGDEEASGVLMIGVLDMKFDTFDGTKW